MAITSSQSIASESETVPKRPVMPLNIFYAAIKGDSDVLIGCLGLQTKEQIENQEDEDSGHDISQSTKDPPFGSVPLTPKMSPFATRPKVTIEASHSAPQQIKTEHQIAKSELQSATRFGDTVLHLLVTNRHNELALKVFENDASLLKAQNKMLETPLHGAAKVGNHDVIQMLIQIDPHIVKDALEETNENGDTVLHMAVKNGSREISITLMKFDRELAYKFNNKMLNPLHVAIEEECESIAMNMIEVDPNLAITQFYNGMFPVHLAARKGSLWLVVHLMEKYPDCAKLVDPHGRNLFHYAAEESKALFFLKGMPLRMNNETEGMPLRMNNETDYEGNTPLHIAAMKGHCFTVETIWKMNRHAGKVQNKQGLTPYQVSKRQLLENSNEDFRRIYKKICAYERAYGQEFSEAWFRNVMEQSYDANKRERTQVMGLGSVLITTVTFAAAFTIPGGYNQENGTPLLWRKYMFWTFILANTFAFILGFLSLFVLLLTALPIRIDTSKVETIFFMLAASSMILAFGLGLYVTLAPVCLPIAIIILVITVFVGSPVLLHVFLSKQIWIEKVANFLHSKKTIWPAYIVPPLLIFSLASLCL